MNILIVHAHHEPQSFSSALAQQAESSLKAAGHQVVVSDLHKMDFDPVSGRENFTSLKDPQYLKQQIEEMHASEVGGFSADVEAEIVKLEQCDALLFSFPLWWFGMPAILKGWCDKVLAMGRIYGGPKLYEGGIGQATKRGMVLMTTGGGPSAYDGWGLNPSLDVIMAPIQHGVLWFNGFLPLEPFVAWSPVRVSDEERAAYLSSLASRMENLFEEPHVQMPPMADFPNWGHDIRNRYIVVVSQKLERDQRFHDLVADEQAMLADWKRQGKLLEFSISDPNDSQWRAFLKLRATNSKEVESMLSELPLAEYLSFQTTELAKPA